MHWGLYPDWQRGQVLARILPPLGHLRVRPGSQAMAVALDARLEWRWGCHVWSWLLGQVGFPQTATRGQQAPSAEEFSVAQVRWLLKKIKNQRLVCSPHKPQRGRSGEKALVSMISQ